MSITGDRLRSIRKLKGKTLLQVHEELGVSISGLASVERGENSCNASTLKLLADYYDVSTDYLSGKSDEERTSSNIDNAFYEAHGLNDEQRKEVENFIAFLKSKEGK